MGSLPQLSILKGATRKFAPNFINDIIENLSLTEASEKTAIIFEDDEIIKKYTYYELNSITNKLAKEIKNVILSNELQRNSDGDYIVAVNVNPSDQLLLILLAIWKAGAAYLPLDHGFPGNRIEHIVRESRPALIIYDEEINNETKYYVNSYIISTKDLFENAKHQNEDSLSKETKLKHINNDLAVVLYTSGSTGVPKGVRLPHKVILNRLNWQFKAFPFHETEKVCVFKTTLTFVDSISEIWGPLIKGLTLLIVPKGVTKDPENLSNLIDRYQVQRIVLVPTLLKSLLLNLELQNSESTLRSVKTWVCSGEPLSVSLAYDFFKYFPENEHRLCNFYGCTEVMADVTYYIISNPHDLKHQTKVPIGVPLDNTIIYLLDTDYRPVKNGDVGEIFVAGLNIAAGYVNGRDPEKFVENPLAVDPTYLKMYRTGDFGKVEKGVLIYEGRTDSQIKIRGNRVDLSEVEKACNAVEGVSKAIVLCYKPGDINQALLAFVTTNMSITEKYIETILKKTLTSYMIPQVILVESIPLLVNGKVDRQSLLKNYENTNNNNDDYFQVNIDYSGVQPHQMQAAKVLFNTIANVLNRTARYTISIDANFYELGGNSLNSIYTITKLNKKGFKIGIGDFIAAIDLGEVLERMTSGTIINIQPPRYTSHLLQENFKNSVYEIITNSFLQKGGLEQHIITELSESSFTELMDLMWDALLEKNLSFAVMNENNQIIGVALNFDARDEPPVEVSSRLSVVFELLEQLESPILENILPPGKGTVLHSFMMGTHSSLTTKENVLVIRFMENEVARLAKERKFVGVFTTNTSPITQQLGSDVFDYQTLLDYPVNQFVARDRTKPFGLAPNSERAMVQWKVV